MPSSPPTTLPRAARPAYGSAATAVVAIAVLSGELGRSAVVTLAGLALAGAAVVLLVSTAAALVRMDRQNRAD